MIVTRAEGDAENRRRGWNLRLNEAVRLCLLNATTRKHNILGGKVYTQGQGKHRGEMQKALSLS